MDSRFYTADRWQTIVARLIETKAPVTFREQDAAHLREAAETIEGLRAALGQLLLTSLTAYHIGDRDESEAAMAAATGSRFVAWRK
jgi:hypothetical protein